MGATSVAVLPDRQVVFPETVFRAGAATDVPLKVQGAPGQTANLMEFYNSDGVLINYVNSAGMLGGAGSDDTNAMLWMNNAL